MGKKARRAARAAAPPPTASQIRRRAAAQPEPPVLGSLDLTRREFCIMVASLCIQEPGDLLLDPTVGSVTVGKGELDALWNKLQDVALLIEEDQAVEDEQRVMEWASDQAGSLR